MPDIRHIRGDTFSVAGRAGGQSFAGWTGRSQVRDALTKALLSELEFTWLNAEQGSFIVQTDDTEHWPAGGSVRFDVELTSAAGFVVSSRAITIPVDEDVTRDD